MKKICGIYKFTNKINNKAYIGKSLNIYARYKTHLRNLENGKLTYFYTALRKYGIENFNFEIIKECSKEELNYYECLYIALYNTHNKEFGYNMTDGGDGGKTAEEPWNKGKGNYFSEDKLIEMGKKISIKLKGKNNSEEHNKHIKENHSHYWKGKESPWKGKHPTKESRILMSESHKGQRKGMHWYKDPVTNKRIWY